MELRSQHCIWTLSFSQVFLSWCCLGLSVHFQSQLPLYVVKGQSLTLQPQVDLRPGEQITVVTWDHQPEDKKSSGKVRVAEVPGKRMDGRVGVDQRGVTLKVGDFRITDSGVYTITVTGSTGGNGSAQRTVREYEPVHHVSVMVNTSHSSLHCMETWGTEPKFSWLHEKAAVTEAVGNISPDGTWLYISSAFCGHFTCVVSNKLGHSSATYTAAPCQREGKGTGVAVICVILLLVTAGALAFLLWRRHMHYRNRGERLHEHMDDPL